MNAFNQITSFPILLLHFLLFLLISITLRPLSSHGCHEEERRALLKFKSSLDDPSGRLSSWQECVEHQNCCDWRGIRCSGESFHVISIDLRNIDFERFQYDYVDSDNPSTAPNTALRGRLSPYLFNITNLEYLDLGFNDFQESEITHQLSHLTKLAHLDLSISNFSSSISKQFNNLTLLVYLDLSCIMFGHLRITSCLESPSTEWVGGLVNLQELRLNGIDLSQATSSKDNFGQHISYLWNLRDLDISGCNIAGPDFPIHEFHNLSHLSTLKMNHNRDLNTSIPLQLVNLTSLSILELSVCDFQGSIPYLPQLKELDVSLNRNLDPDQLTRMFEQPWPELQTLDISETRLTRSIPSSIYNLSRLQHLDLSFNNVTNSIHSSISNLKDLTFLDLSDNNLQGSIPESICNIFRLQHLNLHNNKISGTIPSCITNLQNLSYFDVSSNSITGKISLISLINELDLTHLDLSSNNLTVFIDQDHLYPSKSKLESLILQSCSIQGHIPASICNFTHFKYLEISYNNLTGPIPSCIYRLKKLSRLYLSNNRLHGSLPLLPPNVDFLDLSNNKLDGEISIEVGESLSRINNELPGSIPSSLCSQKHGMPHTMLIDLSNNKLSGIIPTSIGNCLSLGYLNLAYNNLSGNVLNELKHTSLEYLELNENNLNSSFPMSLILKLSYLTFLNLGNNNFEGIIPTGLGSLGKLMILSARSNRFNGSIPKDIIHLQELRILDLSLNNFSGQIPSKLGYLTALTRKIPADNWASYIAEYQLTIKGTAVKFEYSLLHSAIDLSCNIFGGNIPEEIGLLQGLGVLNLSHNHLSSIIPASIGNMSSLESLDLSSNRLSGHIPQSLTSIDSLGFLNLSHNNLSGKIPTKNHFDTLSLDGSAFAGNDLLCGFPLKKDCEGDHNISTGRTNPSSKASEDDQEDGQEKLLLYAIVFMGFAVGFWGLFFVLLIKKHKWWFPYWRTIDFIVVKIVEGCIQKN